MTERVREGLTPQDQGLVELRSIGIEKAKELRDKGIETARQMNVSGFLVVYSRTEMQECSEAVGPGAKSFYVKVAGEKIKTVLATRRSTSVQGERMKTLGQRIEDFGNLLGTTIAGGVAIFSDETHTDFVGAIAFSGGLPEQDEAICRTAVETSGLYTDLPNPPEIK